MAEEHDRGEGSAEQAGTGRAETPWQRRRRLAEIFGDVFPESTKDDREEASAAERESASERWLKSQVPPHHGG